jgi:hypothetical protein
LCDADEVVVGPTGFEIWSTPAQATPNSKDAAGNPWVPLFNGKNMEGFYTYIQRSGKIS